MAELKKMSFKDSYRLERVYYENMWTLLNLLKGLKDNHNATEIEKINELLENAIADNESIIIIYKNLGELYAEVQNNFTEIGKELKELRDNLESWKDEINDKIDDVNNTIMSYIREIWERLDAIEADLASMNRVKIYNLNYDSDNDKYYITDKNGNTVDFDKISDDAEFPHYVVLIDENGNYYIPDNIDDSAAVFRSDGINTNGEYQETLVAITNADVVTVVTNTLKIPEYTAGDGISIQDYEITNTAPGITYTAGAGIEIDSQNNQIDVGVGTGLNIDATDNLIKNTGLFPFYDKETQYYYKANAMQVDNYLPTFNHDYTALSRNYINFNIQQADYNLVTDNVVDLPYGYRIEFTSDIANKILKADVSPFGSANGNAILEVEAVYRKTRRSDTQSFYKQYVVPFSILMDSTFDITSVPKCLEIKLNETLDLSGLYGENIKTEFANFSISYKINIVGQLYFSNAHVLDSQIEIPNIVKAFNENPIYFYRLERDY